MLISFAVTAKLICAFVLAYADCWFSGAAAHFPLIKNHLCIVYIHIHQCCHVYMSVHEIKLSKLKFFCLLLSCILAFNMFIKPFTYVSVVFTVTECKPNPFNCIEQFHLNSKLERVFRGKHMSPLSARTHF